MEALSFCNTKISVKHLEKYRDGFGDYTSLRIAYVICCAVFLKYKNF